MIYYVAQFGGTTHDPIKDLAERGLEVARAQEMFAKATGEVCVPIQDENGDESAILFVAPKTSGPRGESFTHGHR